MINLGNIKPSLGANKNSKRIGRGIGSGFGKTAGKGHKGQKARKGGGIPAGFEGGQTPLYRRIPKYGFKRVGEKVTLISLSNLKDLCKNDQLNKEILVEKGLIRKKSDKVKLLANGYLEKKVHVELDAISASAKRIITELGGSTKEV